MSSIGHAASSMLTPKSGPHASHNSGLSHRKPAQEINNVRLSFNSVIGTTTDSVNAFDALAEHHTFVCCAGSSAVLARVDEHLNVTQQLFRARANASPINATPSFYNPATPPNTRGKSRHESPLKDGGYGTLYNAVQDYHPNSPRQGRAANRTRETSCVSLSRGGDLMAVGETGYNPRVLIFSTASGSPSDVPLSILSDHSFGISSVAFSDDSRWLCTLGNTYDGFILIYSINAKARAAKLHSSNKCSNVHRVIWMGHSVISIGIRHAKVWRTTVSPLKTRFELDSLGIGSSKSPTPKAFAGRNCLLGPLMDATFTCAAAISDCRAILCTKEGDICLLDDSHETQHLERIAHVDFGILCVVFFNDHIWIGGRHGNMRSMHLDTLIKPTTPVEPPVTISPLPSIGSDMMPDTIAIGFVRSRVVTIDSCRVIQIQGSVDTGRECDSKRLAAHESAVLGVSDLLPKSRVDDADFFTWSAKGTVLFWLLNGACTGGMKIALDQPVYTEGGDTNDLKIVVPLESDEHLLSGDKMGILRLIDRSADKETVVQAHSGDINSIAVANLEGLTIVATGGRDRALQVFRRHEFRLDLIQTLQNEHTAAVGEVKFLEENTLVSISSDRTIIVRKLARGEGQLIAFLPVRIITLKASPVSLSAVPGEPNLTLVSTLDKQILKYDVFSGRLLHSFKASDPTTGDSLLMSSLEVHELDHLATVPRLILGVSSTDKSIRIHEYDSGAMLTSEYGQNGVSVVKLLRRCADGSSPRDHVVSCGLDGTVMTWNLFCNSLQSTAYHDAPDGEESPSRQILPSVQPLRRILSKAELSNLRQSLASESDTVTPLRGSPPSRARRKTSRYSLASGPRISAPTRPYPAGASLSPADTRVRRQLSQGHSPTPLSQKVALKSRSKPPALDILRRSKSATNLNNLNDLGEQICTSLRTLRRSIAPSTVATLEHNMIVELTKELNLTVSALDDKANSKDVSGKSLRGDVMKMHLGTAKTQEMTMEDGPRQGAKGLEELSNAHVGKEEEGVE